ncbi:ATP-dependent Clp protease proteolytic subunit [uncultured archaeon]|nr:ATP-dependent Clp protease proteolytic subunit [uncultured archaeon]
MRIKLSSQPQEQNGNWLKYGGVILLGVVFLVFLGILLFSSVTVPALGGKCVGIVDLNQEITTQSASPSLFSTGSPGSEDIANAIDNLNSRDDVGAVVFVVDSPGGSVVATREIYDSVKGLKKPKVAYFREVAASGAYYISTGTDYIISDPDALTGSIGVIMTVSDLSGLFGKIGYNETAIKSGDEKDIGGYSRPMTDKDRQILQALVNEVFGEFKNIVITNRGSRLDLAKFNEILDARVLSGRQAKEIGLVDALGTKKDAIKKAAALANITDSEPKICTISTSPSAGGIFGATSMFRGMLEGLLPQDAQKVSVKYE